MSELSYFNVVSARAIPPSSSFCCFQLEDEHYAAIGEEKVEEEEKEEMSIEEQKDDDDVVSVFLIQRKHPTIMARNMVAASRPTTTIHKTLLR